MSQLPSSTKVLIVGAGPSGLTTAISLIKHGLSVHDIVIVDSVTQGENSSRATVLHAATMEALESIDCAEELDSAGLHMEGMRLQNEQGSIFMTNDLSSLHPHTKYPYACNVSQAYTEKTLHKRFESLSGHVFRPLKAVGMKPSTSGLEVTFDSGESITALYVIAADGSRSVIRTNSGITFADPDGLTPDEMDPRTSQVVLADVSFTGNLDHVFRTDPFQGAFTIGEHGMFLTAPLGHPKVHSEIYHSEDPVYRIGFSIHLGKGEAPSRPSIDIIQKYVDQQGPAYISSDPSRNPTPVKVKNVYWSTRFRTHSAIADTFFKRIRGDTDKESGGIVMLVGDAAHIHSPIGGQGMNLGIRDAVGLGATVAKHIQVSNANVDTHFELLREFAEDRRGRALKQIDMTKRFVWMVGSLMNPYSIQYWFLYVLGNIPFMKRKLVWQLSGLGNR